jgi:hypothetical protein
MVTLKVPKQAQNVGTAQSAGQMSPIQSAARRVLAAQVQENRNKQAAQNLQQNFQQQLPFVDVGTDGRKVVVSGIDNENLEETGQHGKKKQSTWNLQNNLQQHLSSVDVTTGGTKVMVGEERGSHQFNKANIANKDMAPGGAEQVSNPSMQPHAFGVSGKVAVDGNGQPSCEAIVDSFHPAPNSQWLDLQSIFGEDPNEGQEHAEPLDEGTLDAENPWGIFGGEASVPFPGFGDAVEGQVPAEASGQDYREAMIVLDMNMGVPPPAIDFDDAWPDSLQISGEFATEVFDAYGSVEPYTWSLDDLVVPTSGLRTPGRMD